MNSCKYMIISIGAGTIFQLGEQKMNDFSTREAKIGQAQSRQSNSEYNFMQCVFFQKGIRSVQWGPEQSPRLARSWGIFENFCVKSNRRTSLHPYAPPHSPRTRPSRYRRLSRLSR